MNIVELIEQEDLYQANIIISTYDKKEKRCINIIEKDAYYAKSLMDKRFVALLDNSDFFTKIARKDIHIEYNECGNEVLRIGNNCENSYLHNGRICTHCFTTYKTKKDYLKQKIKRLRSDIEADENRLKLDNQQLQEYEFELANLKPEPKKRTII